MTLTRQLHSADRDACPLCEESDHVVWEVKVRLIRKLRISRSETIGAKHTGERLLNGPSEDMGQPRQPSNENSQGEHAECSISNSCTQLHCYVSVSQVVIGHHTTLRRWDPRYRDPRISDL